MLPLFSQTRSDVIFSNSSRTFSSPILDRDTQTQTALVATSPYESTSLSLSFLSLGERSHLLSISKSSTRPFPIFIKASAPGALFPPCCPQNPRDQSALSYLIQSNSLKPPAQWRQPICYPSQILSLRPASLLCFLFSTNQFPNLFFHSLILAPPLHFGQALPDP